MTEEEVRAMFICVDCKTDTYEESEYYMVHDHVWVDEAKMHKQGGMLCIGCLEKRIGRTLTAMDFIHAPINLPGFMAMSKRLQNRHSVQPSKVD